MKRTLAMLLVLAIFCAFFFVALEAEHDCAGEDCLICAVLTGCLRLMNLAAAFVLLLALAGVAFCLLLRADRTARFCRFSLIEQKVKLSN